jgi:hypothetical protein
MFGTGEETTQPAINLRLEPVFLKEETVSFQVRLVDAGEAPQALAVSARPVGHMAGETSRAFQAAGAEPFAVELGELAPGLYELTVGPQDGGAGAPTPTHGVFEVVDTSIM